MAAPFSSLRLSAFRGASQPFTLAFDPKTKLTIVYGENGTGKTTICDGFEFLAKGDIGSLVGKGIDAGRHKYWHSADKQPEDLLVELHGPAGPICSGKMKGSNADIVPLPNRPSLSLMRRKQMLDLVEAKPGERYEAIRRFVDINAFEQSEASLKKLKTDLAAEKKLADTAVLQNYSALTNLSTAAGSPQGTDPVGWARTLVAQPDSGQAAEQSAVDDLIVQYQVLSGYPERLQELRSQHSQARARRDESQEQLVQLASSASADAGEVIELLEAGQTYLHSHPDSEVCPLCESAEKAAELRDRITVKLKQFAALKGARGELAQREQALKRLTDGVEDLQKGYAGSLAKYATALSGHSWDEKYQFPATPPPDSIDTLKDWLQANDDMLSKWKHVDAALRQSNERRENARFALEDYDGNEDRANELALLIPKVEEAHTIVQTKRQTFTDTILAEIAEKAGELYEMVHPGEGKDKIVLQIDQAKRASVDLNTPFSGKVAPPQAYFSQSHVDTLGLAIFLALALRERPSDVVLILDDVLGSVDEPHVDRVIAMICAVVKDFRHTIITTHYGPWRHKYRWGLIKGGQPCQFVELVDTGVVGVMRSVGSVPEIEVLKGMVAAVQLDLQGIVGKAGVVLEALLNFIVEKYGCRVPYRPNGKLTLGELMPSIKGKLRDHLAFETLNPAGGQPAVVTTVSAKPILDQLHNIGFVRNEVGAHFNTDAFNVPDGKAFAYASQVIALAEAMICPDHGWPASDKSGNHWSNGGDTRRMRPFKEPK